MKIPRLFSCFLLGLALVPVLPAFAADVKKKVLVVTVTTGFRHSSIPTAEKILTQLAQESGKFSVEFVHQPEGMKGAPGAPRPGAKGESDPAYQAALAKFKTDEKEYREVWLPRAAQALQKLSAANLKNYDAVLFASTTGDLPLPDPQALVDWVAQGHAFIGLHAATDTFHGFPPFIAMLGGEFKTHGPQVTVEAINQDPAHAACQPLPARWTVFDEIYQFKSFSRAQVHGLVSLEKLQLDNNPEKKETPGDYPVAWSRMHGKGRVFYTSFGHREDLWDPTFTDKAGRKNSEKNAQLYQQHVLGGILWALGLAPGKAQP